MRLAACTAAPVSRPARIQEYCCLRPIEVSLHGVGWLGRCLLSQGKRWSGLGGYCTMLPGAVQPVPARCAFSNGTVVVGLALCCGSAGSDCPAANFGIQ